MTTIATTTTPVTENVTYSFDNNICLDSYLAQLYFENFKEDFNGRGLWLGNHETDYLVLFESQDVMYAPHYKKSALRKMRKDDLMAIICEMECNSCFYPYVTDDNTKAEIIDDLMRVTNKQFYENHYKEIRWNYLECDFTCRGYSQGEAIKVKLVGKMDSYVTRNYIEHIFYDTPICGSVTIFADEKEINEIHFHDQDVDMGEYDMWDKALFISKVSAITQNEPYHDQLQAYLEETLDYNCPAVL